MNSKNGQFWCANEVNPRTLVVSHKKWADCNPGCPLETPLVKGIFETIKKVFSVVTPSASGRNR